MQTYTSVEFLNSQGLSSDFVERFNSKFEKSDGCWNWTACKSKHGYGIIVTGIVYKRRILAHRASWLIHNGIIPDFLNVCHHCDNPACVRPDHLFLGTQRDNMEDMCKKGRNTLGEVNGMHKLTAIQVIEIRNLHPSKSLTQLSKQFGITFQAISKVVNRQRWAHIK